MLALFAESSTEFLQTVPRGRFLRSIARFGLCALKGVLILAGAKPAR